MKTPVKFIHFTNENKTMEKIKITSYKDLDVYMRSYKASLIVMKEIVPMLPSIEKFDLSSQLSISSKSIPRLIAEGFAKKHQKEDSKNILTMH